jgi:hypothetical protein
VALSYKLETAKELWQPTSVLAFTTGFVAILQPLWATLLTPGARAEVLPGSQFKLIYLRGCLGIRQR